ncbi:TonB-dependent receptor plug domain-containing protein [Olivibacter domesticus]|uniref:Outer membrane cobalamin receptor protein n=1 Tax=Olivibacter domesticus TaxID=407022 RepID=A0A1H7IS79_OLID1|nr:TonB-dependent receptor plug domain-containing protein [Olivibacter domesticus]SEK65343.1 Outer membrane cobalamin receptor protein [Olivibacter domesticus]
MDTVTVSSLKNSLVLRSTTPLQLLSKKQLQQLNSLSVADATRFLSGVQLKDYGGIGGLKTINIRSMGSNQTQIFLDGIAIGNAQNGQVDLGKFSLENVDEIALYNGDTQTLLQPAKSYSSASSMYLTSNTPTFENGETRKFRAGIKTGSFGLINPSFLFQKQINQYLTASISTEYLNAHGHYKFRLTDANYDTTARRENADIDAFRIESILNGKIKGGAWQTHLYFYHSGRGLPDAVIENRLKPTSPELGQRQKDRNIFIQSSLTKQFSRYSYTLKLKYANDYVFYSNPNIIKLEGPLKNNYHQQEGYASFANQYLITPEWTVALSSDWQWNKLNADLYNFSYPTRFTTLVSAATKYQTERFTLQSSLLATFVQDKTKYYQSPDDKHEITPAVSLSWQPFEYPTFRIRSFYKNIFRMPTFNDLYYTEIGSTLLDPEYTEQFDFGFTYAKTYHSALKFVSLQTDAYYNIVKNKIIATPASNQFRWTMYNLDRVQIKGVDVVIRSGWNVANCLNLDVGINYTFQEALNATTINGKMTYNKGEQIPYIPRHSGSFILQANINSLFLNYSFIYTGERYSQAENITANYLQPWYTHDLSIGKDFSLLKQGKMRVMTELNNLLNQPYEVVRNFPMPGRNYRLRATIDF